MDAVAMFEAEDDRLAGVVVEHGGTRLCEYGRVAETSGAQHAVADRNLERRAAAGTERRRDKVNLPPTGRAKRLMARNRPVARQADGWQQGVEHRRDALLKESG